MPGVERGPGQTFFADPALDRAFDLDGTLAPDRARRRFPWTVFAAKNPGRIRQ